MVNRERPDEPGWKKGRRRRHLRQDRPDLDPTSMELLDLLRKRRRELGLTIYDIAKRVGISPSYVSLLENGRQVPDRETAARIGAALALDPALMGAYEAWVQLRRHDTAASAFDAARKLRDAWATLEQKHPRLASAGLLWFEDPGGEACAPLHAAAAPDAEGAAEGAAETTVLRVPVVAEGRELRTPRVRVREWLALDPKMLPAGIPIIDPFAWKLSVRGARRVRDLLRPGEYVVITRVDLLDRAPDFGRDEVWLVRHFHELVLTRIVSKGSALVLLAPPGGEEHTEIVNVPEHALLLQILAGKVVTTIRPWGGD